MKRLALVLLLIATPVSAQTVLWFDGAERGDGSGFTLGGPNTGNCTAQALLPVPRTGAYALKTNSCYFLTNTAFSQATIFWRFYYWLDVTGIPAASTLVSFANNGVGSIQMNITSGRLLFFGFNNLTPIATGSTAVTTGVWHLIEAKATYSATVGGLEVKLDGHTEFSSFGTNTGATAAATLGFGQSTVQAIVDGYDDMMACSGAYCPAGRSIARQGTSGSPTYTAWTKNSCTSSLIENCWSQTPFNATPNASSATASDAQTMNVASFGATQSGHGTEVIAAHDTINACKAAGIIKSGTAAAPLSIRRRLNGTDTDTAKTLTTSDAYYDDGIWTTTTDILRDSTKMEVGALHGTGVATDTVEDMWITCDYLAGSAPIRHRTILR